MNFVELQDYGKRRIVNWSNKMILNMVGVEYAIIFSDETICNSFIKHMHNCDLINIVKESSSRRISLSITDRLIDLESRLSNSNYLFVNDYTFDEGMEYLFNIKDFFIYLDTKNDSIVVYASTNILHKYCFEIFKHLHFKIFYQMKSIMLHAGAVYTQQAVLVFAGESCAGKSTTCARCILEGTQYLTDENLIFTNDRNNIVLTTLETRLAIRCEAINLFPELNKFTFDSYSERLFVKKFENNKNNMSIIVEKYSSIKIFLIFKNSTANKMEQLLKSTLRRTSGTYMLDQYKINLLRFVTIISNNMHVWTPPIDSVAFSNDLNNLLALCEKGKVEKL